MIKKLYFISLCIGLGFSLGKTFSQEPAAKAKKVFISQIVEHPALDQTTKGIKDALTAHGYKRGLNLELRVESAQANPSLATSIASKFMSQNPDVVVGVGTISAQSFIKYAMQAKVNVVFSSVTDPLSAELVSDLKKPNHTVSGVSNFVPLEPQLELFKKLLPASFKKLGILYNPGELNSLSIVKKLEDLCPQFGLQLIKQTINKTGDVPQAAAKLAKTSDAIFISNDNTALSAFQSIVKATEQNKVPVFVSDTDAVKLGALAALGPNQYEVGKQTGEMIVRLLKGDSIKNQEVEFPKKTELYINLATAKKLNIKISEDVLKSASKVMGGEKKEAVIVGKKDALGSTSKVIIGKKK